MPLPIRPTTRDVLLALLEPGDCERLRRFFDRLSPLTRYRRFLRTIVRLEQVEPQRLLNLDHRDREAVAAVVADEIIGVARYARLQNGDSAEIAIVVEDAWQRRRVGSQLMCLLRCRAYAAEINTFNGLMHADNRPVIEFLRSLFPAAKFELEAGLLEVEIPISPSM